MPPPHPKSSTRRDWSGCAAARSRLQAGQGEWSQVAGQVGMMQVGRATAARQGLAGRHQAAACPRASLALLLGRSSWEWCNMYSRPASLPASLPHSPKVVAQDAADEAHPHRVHAVQRLEGALRGPPLPRELGKLLGLMPAHSGLPVRGGRGWLPLARMPRPLLPGSLCRRLLGFWDLPRGSLVSSIGAAGAAVLAGPAACTGAPRLEGGGSHASLSLHTWLSCLPVTGFS